MNFARRFGAWTAALAVAAWLCAWLWAGGGFARGADWSRQALYDTSAAAGFTVRDVLVEGRENTDPDVLRALLGVEKGDPIFTFRPAEAKERVERLPWVKEARVERRLPQTIYIRIAERRPMALWQNRKKLRLIDREGVTLADSGLEKFAGLPIVVGEDAPARAAALFDLLAAEPAIGNRVEAAARVGGRRWDLTLESGTVVRLPEGDEGLALRRLAAAQEDDGILDRNLKAVDLREPDRIILRSASGAPEEYKGGTPGRESSI